MTKKRTNLQKPQTSLKKFSPCSRVWNWAQLIQGHYSTNSKALETILDVICYSKRNKILAGKKACLKIIQTNLTLFIKMYSQHSKFQIELINDLDGSGNESGSDLVSRNWTLKSNRLNFSYFGMLASFAVIWS